MQTGFWPLFRYDPREARAGAHPFHLDSRKPSKPFKELAMQEARFAMLARTDAERAEHCLSWRKKTSTTNGTITNRWRVWSERSSMNSRREGMSVDLSTNYLGMKLRNPLGVAACSPLTGDVDVLRKLEDAGAAVAVLPSLFEEQIEHEELEFNRLFEYQSESFAEALTHFPGRRNTTRDRGII